MATAAELTTRLTQINEAVTAIETGGQSFVIDGITYTRVNAAWLYKQQTELEQRLSRKNGGRPLFHTCNFSGLST